MKGLSLRTARFLVAWVVSSCALAGGQIAHSSPMQKIELGKLGYVYPQLTYKRTLKASEVPELYNHQIPHIVFLDENRLAAYYSTLAAVEDVKAIKGSEQPFPRSLSVFFIESDKMSLAKRDWPARNRRWMQDTYDTEQTVMPVHDGKFIVHSGGELLLYDPNLNILSQRELKVSEEDTTEEWAVMVAMGGDSIYLHHSRKNEPSSDQWLNIDTLQPEAAITSPQSVAIDATNKFVLTSGRACLLIATREKPAVRLLCGDRAQMSGAFLSGPSVLAEDRHQLQLLSLAGKVLWSKVPTGKSQYASAQGFRRCLSGERFAVLLTGTAESSWEGVPPKATPTVAVYSRDGRLLLAVTDGPKVFDDFALSSSGNRLAILDHKTLYLYDIP